MKSITRTPSPLPSSLFPAPCSLFPVPSHKAFSLVELLVVIGIIGILSGIMLMTFGSSSESARAAQCLSNMKNLASACQTYGMATGRYPNAGSVEILEMDDSEGKNHVKRKYTERQGWISWDSEGHYSSESHNQNATIGLYCDDEKKSAYALTNGCLWKYVSENRKVYVCPKHVLKAAKSSPPLWSYLMNANFGWDTSKGANSYSTSGGNHTMYGSLSRADRMLLFAEVPFMGYSSWQPEGSEGSEETDAILQFSTGSLADGDKGKNLPTGEETIGANHVIGKTLYAHVAYADGHVEKLRIPYTGSAKAPKVTDEDLKNLTAWLCAGIDVSFSNKKYNRIDKQQQ